MAKESGSNNLLIIGMAVLAWMAYTGKLQIPQPSPAPAPAPTVVVPADLAAAAEPIKQIAMGNPAAAKSVGSAFRDFKEVVLRDESRLKTTDDLRLAIQTFEQLLWSKTTIAGSMPGFSAAASKVVSTAIGLESVPLDASKRKRAGEAFDAISVALGA